MKLSKAQAALLERMRVEKLLITMGNTTSSYIYLCRIDKKRDTVEYVERGIKFATYMALRKAGALKLKYTRTSHGIVDYYGVA